jgi:hypothetical protein
VLLDFDSRELPCRQAFEDAALEIDGFTLTGPKFHLDRVAAIRSDASRNIQVT